MPHVNDDDGEKGTKTKGSSKAKDLSHVPCKFFKVGACTAGAACPFSHSGQESGAQKEVCAWFVKGNCKFGHKCALAHVLPGQSMTMDRKNKKAAQVAAGGGQGSSGKEGGRGGKSRRDVQAGGNARNPLLSGSTAPTRGSQTSTRSPLPLPLKATISPSAPAPALTDTEFAAFGLPDDDGRELFVLPSEGVTGSSGQHAEMRSHPMEESTSPPTSPFPVGTPSAPRHVALAHPRSPGSMDFGPVGSPPRSIATQSNSAILKEGLSPGTSPSRNNTFLPSSPFSAPGIHSSFQYDTVDASNFKARSGIAASLGTSRAWRTELGPVPLQVSQRSGVSQLSGGDMAVEDEDLEDFIPSSLTDLLTPAERSRRMSRSNSGQPMMAALNDQEIPSQRTSAEGGQHRYSRSVPSQSLIGDIRSIWAGSSQGAPASPDRATGIGNYTASIPSALSGGTSSSFKSSPGFGGGRSFGDESLSPAFLSPTNASAAFLPGLHHHYLNSKISSQETRNLSQSHLTSEPTNNPSTGHLVPTTSSSVARPPSHLQLYSSRVAPELGPSDHAAGNTQRGSGRPIPGYALEGDELSSPSTRALQAHAPGQSLPQGLAAGYSRIHALPAAQIGLSPSAYSPGAQKTASQSGTASHDWQGQYGSPEQPPSSANSGLESMFSRLSYSAAISRGPQAAISPLTLASGAGNGPPPGIAAPGMARNPSGRNWQTQGPLSPLGGPVVTGDDDDVFCMDG